MYRRQEFIRNVCRAIDYQGRFVWIVPATEVRLLATQHAGPSRIRYRKIDLHEPPSVLKMVAREGRATRLTDRVAIAALPVLRNRRRDLFVFLHPDIVRAQDWVLAPGDKLSPEEMAALDNESNKFDKATMNVARAVCTYRGLLKDGDLTWVGKRLRTLYDIKHNLA